MPNVIGSGVRGRLGNREYVCIASRTPREGLEGDSCLVAAVQAQAKNYPRLLPRESNHSVVLAPLRSLFSNQVGYIDRS